MSQDRDWVLIDGLGAYPADNKTQLDKAIQEAFNRFHSTTTDMSINKYRKGFYEGLKRAKEILGE